MTSARRDPLAHRVLVFAPVGRDGELSARILEGAGLWTKRCGSAAELCDELRVGAAALITTEEALFGGSLERVATALGDQPKWSDLPVILCTTGGDGQRTSVVRTRALSELGNVMVVERPMQTRTLLAAVHAGLRARSRQLALRDVVVELEETAAERAALLVSEQHARAEAEDANRTKDEFLAMVSHELRTPLNAILGWSRLLTEGRLDEAQRARALATIDRNAIAQARLVDELLDVSRIISRKLRLTLRPLDLRGVVEVAVDSLRPAAESKGLALTLALGDDLAGADATDDAAPPTRVLGDSDRLAQILSNLLGNAIKFTPSGGRVDVLLTKEQGNAKVVVRDDGIGIRPDFVPFVFERFRQADGSRTRAHGGLGLGLAIARHLAELHGGDVRAASEGLGKGAELTLTIPLVLTGHLDARGSERPPASSASLLAGLRVVVVDDEQDARELVTTVLERAGAIVTPVGSADAAMHAIRERAPSLIVSDIGMPGEDGYALITRVRALSPELGGRVPAVAVTAFTRSEDRARALRAGYTAHMAKPIDPGELVTIAANVTSVANATRG